MHLIYKYKTQRQKKRKKKRKEQHINNSKKEQFIKPKANNYISNKVNFYQNISNLHEHQHFMVYLKT